MENEIPYCARRQNLSFPELETAFTQMAAFRNKAAIKKNY